MKLHLASLSPDQVAAVQVLLKQEQMQRQRLEAAIIEMQKGRLSNEEQQEADREAYEREKAAFIAHRQAAERMRAEPEMPQRMPEVPVVPQPAIEGVLHQLATRLQAIEVALGQNRGQMPQPVAVQQTAPAFSGAPGFATPGAPPLFYNPALTQNGPFGPWRR